jgi:hypothetical protein
MLFTDMVWMAGVYVAIFMPVIWSTKEKVTVSRLRREELKPVAERQSSLLIVGIILGLALMMLIALVGFLLIRGNDSVPVTKDVVLLVTVIAVGSIVLSGILAVGHLLNTPRLYAYAFVTVMVSALAWWQQIGLPWVLITVGGFIMATGSVYLVRFLLSHPVLPQEERPIWNSVR